MNNKLAMGGIFCDLEKAFDCVDNMKGGSTASSLGTFLSRKETLLFSG
jgi:hypothetical protein